MAEVPQILICPHTEQDKWGVLIKSFRLYIKQNSRITLVHLLRRVIGEFIFYNERLEVHPWIHLLKCSISAMIPTEQL